MIRALLLLVVLGILYSGCVNDETVVEGTEYELKVDIATTCTRYCASLSRCMDIDERDCTSACPHLKEQAEAGGCEVPAVDAMECLIRDGCASGLPVMTLGPGEVVAHPCFQSAAAARCAFDVPIADKRPFAFFGSGVGLGRCGADSYESPARCSDGRSERSSCTSCGLNVRCEEPASHAVDCTSDGSGTHCTCRVGGRLVRETYVPERLCPLPKDRRALIEVCGWLY